VGAWVKKVGGYPVPAWKLCLAFGVGRRGYPKERSGNRHQEWQDQKGPSEEKFSKTPHPPRQERSQRPQREKSHGRGRGANTLPNKEAHHQTHTFRKTKPKKKHTPPHKS